MMFPNLDSSGGAGVSDGADVATWQRAFTGDDPVLVSDVRRCHISRML